jgi:hypothetical protein
MLPDAAAMITKTLNDRGNVKNRIVPKEKLNTRLAVEVIVIPYLSVNRLRFVFMYINRMEGMTRLKPRHMYRNKITLNVSFMFF